MVFVRRFLSTQFRTVARRRRRRHRNTRCTRFHCTFLSAYYHTGNSSTTAAYTYRHIVAVAAATAALAPNRKRKHLA